MNIVLLLNIVNDSQGGMIGGLATGIATESSVQITTETGTAIVTES